MLDPNFIRVNPSLVKEGTRAKGVKEEIVEEWLKVDQERGQLLPALEELRRQRNQARHEWKDLSPPQRAQRQQELVELKRKIQAQERQLREVNARWRDLLWQIPNLPLPEVPRGEDENDNVVLRQWGEKRKFSFPVRDHLELGEKLDLIDVVRASKVSGSRFTYLKNELVLLEWALVKFAFDFLVQKGFHPVLPPVLIKKEIEARLGYGEHGGWEDMYLLPEDNLVLIATAEHALVALHAEETLPASELPRRYIAFSTCFRREAGSYGKDTRGIIRLHQFNKVEMVSLTRPQDSIQEHQFLVNLEEELMQQLELPYQVVQICSGDLGHPAANKIDLEVWLPGQNRYRETHSCSNCTDYQARRLQIKYEEGGKKEYLHILNGTVFSERPLIAILENYQQKDGSVKVPSVLQPYLNFDKIG